MTKAEFLDRLCEGLSFHSSAEDIQKIVMFYSEAIDDRMEDGQTEAEAVAAMGNLNDIIREARSSWRQEEGREKTDENEDGDRWDGEKARPGQVRRSWDAGEVTRIDVYDTTGDIELLPSPDGQLHAEYTVTDEWRYDVSGERTVTIRRARNGAVPRTHINLFGKVFSFSTPALGGLFTDELNLKLYIPRVSAVTVSVNATSGNVECRDVSLEALFVKIADGDVTAEDTAADGKISLVSVSGDVYARGLSAPELTVNTISGDLTLEDLSAASLALKSVSGDVNASELAVTQRLTAGSVSGDMTLPLTVPCRETSVEAVSGDVALVLAGPDSLYTAVTRTNSGAVHIDGGAFSGANTVRVKTVSGDIGIYFQG